MSNNKSSTSTFYSRSTKTSSNKTNKSKKPLPKKVIPSKKLASNCSENKSCPTSTISSKKYPERPKKTTKSDANVTKKYQAVNSGDYCKKCGDVKENDEKEDINKIVSAMNVKSVRHDNIVKKKSSKPIQQYFKNENFNVSAESLNLNAQDILKNSLDTIKEVSERHNVSEESIFMIYSDSDEDITYLDPDDDENIEKLKEFRNKNYFECHSAKSRIKTRANVTSLSDHKCVYRFYLNDRLFPVPLNTDCNNKVRCVECHLPMDIKQDNSGDKINGTIQAKVKLGKTTQDMVLLLPIKESLIIKERRKEEREVNNEYVYFGVVKLSCDGNSLFNKTLPHDSLALRYQKGYKEFQYDDRYRYKHVDDDDVIVI
ncbi:uncharacterized protein LOC142981906 [Anticarsia gemmatalis]|uniref:uncharacterized protein LOC142981906 n=1 Tax=Anticarsia gemmatalis TaxID=129554 RepID=UPI003F76AA35